MPYVISGRRLFYKTFTVFPVCKALKVNNILFAACIAKFVHYYKIETAVFMVTIPHSGEFTCFMAGILARRIVSQGNEGTVQRY
jgi:hypothetical protein